MNENKDFQIPERMLLQKDLVAAERVGAGLINRGNTCFVNSILQCLTHTSPLVNYFKFTDHARTCQPTGFCMLCELQTHITNSYAKSGSAIVPESILQNIKLIARNMTLGRQEDAHEFLIYVLNAMQRSDTSGINGWNQFNGTKNTVVDQIFGGVLRSQVQCVQCRGESDTYQPSMDINLEIKNVRTLEEAFSNYVQLESLGDDAYSCANCDKKVQAVKGMAIEKTPNVLTVSLQRFDFMFGKVAHQLRFPERLDIRPYMSITQGDSVMYELYAVVVHSGHSCNSGHYYSYVKSALGNWFMMNDSKVKPVPVVKVLSSQAYLLFYKKCETSNTQKNKPDINTTNCPANGATGESNIVGSLLSSTTSSQGTPDRPMNARNDDKTTDLTENRATVKKKRSWRKAFREEFDHGKENACTTNDSDPLPTRGTTTAPARKRLKCSRVKFVGRRICHEWVEDEASDTRKWYTGTVLRTLSGRDGYKSTVYDILYDGEEESYSVDHLLEDYASSSVKLIDN